MAAEKRLIRFDGQGNPVAIEFADPILGTLRIADPILTSQSQGFRNTELVGDVLFPAVPTEKETGKFPAFGQEAFKLHNTKRNLRGDVAKMNVVQGAVTLTLDEHSLGFELDDRELEEFAVSKETLMLARQFMVDDAVALEREINRAIAATTSGNYSSSNKTSGAGFAWASTGDPIQNIQTGREAIRQAIGRYPNVAIFDPKAWNLFRNNAAVRDRIKYSGSFNDRAMVSTDIAASLLELNKVVVGTAVVGSGLGGGVGETALTKQDVWGAVQQGNVILAYVGTGIMQPGFGMGAIKKGYPKATSYRWEPRKVMVYETEHIYGDIVTYADAGYLAYSIA